MTTTRKKLSTQPLTDENQLERLNREVVPVLRQVTSGIIITGSRGGATVAVLASLLTALANAGIITDRTTA